ncbi:hypothetical protein [Methanomethylovorans sp.]|uniref:hypothetical protein n=1 Tax=Methanomethylovorans sp. TaxID=2758717 RepID=UPI00345E57DE
MTSEQTVHNERTLSQGREVTALYELILLGHALGYAHCRTSCIIFDYDEHSYEYQERGEDQKGICFR